MLISVREVDQLTSVHEEADFLLFLYARNSLKSESGALMRSYSGDTVILVMALLAFSKEPVIIDSGTSKFRKVIYMADVNTNDKEL